MDVTSLYYFDFRFFVFTNKWFFNHHRLSTNTLKTMYDTIMKKYLLFFIIDAGRHRHCDGNNKNNQICSQVDRKA